MLAMWTERLVGLALLGVIACDDGASGGVDTDGGSTTSPATAADDPGDPSAGEGSMGRETQGDAGSTTDGTTTEPSDPTGGGSGLPEGEGCCEAHEGPGCNEQGVAACVCAAAPECCVFDWLPTCAQAAQAGCEATCEPGPGGETDGGTGGTGGTGMACEETVLLQLGADDASLSGDWEISTSQTGEGQIAVVDGGGNGEVLWDIDVPCDDTWTIWVRLFDQGAQDSFFATLDGEPSPPAIFEGGILGPGQGWNWRALNWRDPDDLSMFIEDPWAPEWTVGTHALALSFRESIAVARIEITNDPSYEP